MTESETEKNKSPAVEDSSRLSGSSELSVCLHAAVAGDSAAREELFARCRSYVQLIARAWSLARFQARFDSSDLVQQTLLDAYRDFGKFKGRTEIEWLAWLRQILDHNAQDALRRHAAAGKRAIGRERSLGHETDNDGHARQTEVAAADPTPSAIMILNEQSLLLAEAIDRLEGDHREVVMLRNILRLPFDEVAQRMGRSRPAAQMLWMRAIQRLREHMNELGARSLFEGPSR
ncbi:MAG: sigma-70 family RNA polymerase sigma factor [Planctomyces sp.]|nr:sigma-70 family RNA polymerase sigma factor [Planctomyces sp.]